MKQYSFQISFLLFFTAVFWSCSSVPRGVCDVNCLPSPDYSSSVCWAALPTTFDSADIVPVAVWQDAQATSEADVFFIHPTTYIGKRGQKQWNGDVYDAEINKRTDQYPIRYQASIFNGAGRVYAPRYRQAHLHAFYTEDKKNGKLAIDLAYTDVRNAFQYYLDHYRQGRPFIIAAHSQGSIHALRLLKDFVDGKPLQEKMIVAYMPGYPIAANQYQNIKPCTQPEESGCFCSWRTIREGAMIKKMHFPDHQVVVTNPVTWNADAGHSEASIHMGAILRDLHTLLPSLINTEVHQDVLWVNKPRFPWSFLMTTKNYHIADYNFFYADVRQNAADRVRAYLSRH